jgi:SAM-dependent methyltransferase
MWPNPAFNTLCEEEQREAVDALGLSLQGAMVLDLGCGSGRFSRYFAAKGAQVTGIDFSAVALETARSLSDGPNPAYVNLSLFELDDSGLYDLVFAAAALSVACRTRRELADALVRAGRALKQGGALFLIEPVHRGFLSRTLDMGLGEFLQTLEECGLQAKSVRPLVFWPARLALAYLPSPSVLTAPVYRLGRLLMKAPGLCRLGDYWAIKAALKPSGPRSLPAPAPPVMRHSRSADSPGQEGP